MFAALPLATKIAAVLVALAALLGVLLYGVRQIENAGEAKAQAREAAAAAIATSQAQAEGTRRLQAQSEISNASDLQARIARADAASAAARAAGLRNQLAAIRSRAASDPTPSDSCARERGRSGLLADMLGEAWDFAAAAGAEADGLRIAGTACERSYEALTP